MPSGRVFAGKKLDVGTVSTIIGVVAVSGGGGGVQYSVGDTTIAVTGTGTIIFGINSTTVRGIKVDAAGVVSVSGGGGGVQYSQGDTSIAATGTGTIFFGIASTTARAVKVASDGTVFVSGGGGGVQYSIGDTSMALTGTGTIFIGIQSGATTGRGMLLTTTGSPIVTLAGTPAVTAANVTIASITTGTVNVATGLINISGTVPVTLVSVATVSTVGALLGTSNFIMVSGTVTTGTISISGTSTVVFGATQAVTAANVTIASITTGTVSASLIGQVVSGTTAHGGFVLVPNASKFNAYLLATTSAAGGVIILTSGANTIYITDLLVSVSGPMQVSICSETTAMANAFLATNGGFVFNEITPMICTSAQSLRVVCGSSGSCSVYAAGYRVT